MCFIIPFGGDRFEISQSILYIGGVVRGSNTLNKLPTMVMPTKLILSVAMI